MYIYVCIYIHIHTTQQLMLQWLGSILSATISALQLLLLPSASPCLPAGNFYYKFYWFLFVLYLFILVGWVPVKNKVMVDRDVSRCIGSIPLIHGWMVRLKVRIHSYTSCLNSFFTLSFVFYSYKIYGFVWFGLKD